ncbi:MAG: glycosyltransferase family A protein [Pseudomonadota bacterium]
MISIIIPHFNQPDQLDQCLASLTAQPGALDYEILVVDNGSKSLPEAVVAAHPGVRLIQETTPGPGPARSTGVGETTGEILAFIDADCVADPGWLVAIAARIRAGAQILGGDVRILHADPARPTLWEAYESEFAYRMEHYITRQGFTGTGNLACTRAVFQAVGPFAGIGLAEDRDWGQRATAQGFAITWAPEMIAYHPPRTSFAEQGRKMDRHIGHDFAKITAKPLGQLRWAGRTLAMAGSPIATVPRIARSTRIGGGLRGRLLAFWGVCQTRLYRARVMGGLIGAQNADALADRWRE